MPSYRNFFNSVIPLRITRGTVVNQAIPEYENIGTQKWLECILVNNPSFDGLHGLRQLQVYNPKNEEEAKNQNSHYGNIRYFCF